MPAVVLGMSPERGIFRMQGCYSVEVALRHCIHPLVTARDKKSVL